MQFFWTFIFMVCAISVIIHGEQTDPLVTVQSGQIRGIVEKDAENLNNYHAFLGIPYARVTDRFQAAQPVQPWEGIFDATDPNVRCAQRSPLAPILNLLTFSNSANVVGTEDCLILNVYTPENKTELLPVMVFVHGGGFTSGSSSRSVYGPDYFVKHNVILVSINYRLDILGFLCLGIKDAPGNVGMKDQVEALKWVQNNIKEFGGDPERVTIFGESAGSSSISYHLLSPMSRKLFSKAIMQSGSSLSFWAFQYEPLKIASKLAKQMGYETEDPQELYNIFMNKSVEELISTRVPRDKGNIQPSEFIFVPCAEKEIESIEPFLTETPYEIISQDKFAKVPMIMGTNSEEGYLFASFENDTTIDNIRSTQLQEALPIDLEFPTEEIAKETAETLKHLYFGDKNISKMSLLDLSKYEGDTGFIYPVRATATMMLQTNNEPMFLYKFAYGGILNWVKLYTGFGPYPGATHGDELLYMFKPIFTSLGGLFEKQIINNMTVMWTNFAKYGDPTPGDHSLISTKWQPADKENPEVLVIDKTFSTEPMWNSERLAYLDKTYSKYRKGVTVTHG